MSAGAAEAAAPSRLRMLLILGSLSALGPASMDGYLPALPEISSGFGVSTSLAQLSVAVYLIGLGSGQLIAGPCSDVLGRRRPMLAAIAIYVAVSIGCAASPSLGVLVVCRLLQGVAASAGIVISRAVVRDLYEGREAARFLSRLMMVYGLAPLLAPLLGGAALAIVDWRGIFYGLAGLATILLVAAVRLLPETLPRARRQRSGWRRTGAAFGFLLRQRAFVGYALALGCATGCVVAYVAASSFVMQDLFGVSPQVYALLFGAGAAAMIAVSQLNALLLRRHEPRQLLERAGIGLSLVAVLLLVAVESDLGLWVVAPCMAAVMGFWGVIPANAISLALADHRDIAGSASAVLGVFQYGIAGAISPLVGVGGSDTALPMAVAILALSLLSMAAIAFLVGGSPTFRARGGGTSAPFP